MGSKILTLINSLFFQVVAIPKTPILVSDNRSISTFRTQNNNKLHWQKSAVKITEAPNKQKANYWKSKTKSE